MKIVRRIILFIFIVFAVIVGYFTADGYMLYKKSMSETGLEDRVSNLKEAENFIHLSDVPDYYKNAVVSIEDHRFYSHHGVDIVATSRAFINNIVTMELQGGGSSITQQVAKNLCFTQEKTLTRKVAELFVVYHLEKDYEKDDILELYINNMYFGNGYYNIYDAAKGYYDKYPADLSLYEATLLAGVPNAPSVYAPTVNLKLAEERQAQVLDAMVKYGTMSKEEADSIKAQQKTR